MKIVFTDADTVTTGDLGLEMFERFGEVTAYGVTAPDEVIERVRDADVIICNKTLITKEVMDSAPNVKYIGILATGTNNVDLAYARGKGIAVTNVPGYSTDGVVQLTFSYILELCGRLSEYRESVNAGDWKKSRTFSYFPFPIK